MSDEETIVVDFGTAEYFYNQCTGEYPGHGAYTPYNPVIQSLIKSQSREGFIMGRTKFAKFLRAVADQLDESESQAVDDLPF